MNTLTDARGFKWVIGLVYIVLAVVLAAVGRIGLFEAAILFGIGVILI